MPTHTANNPLLDSLYTVCNTHPIDYAQYIERALYTPKFGYYKQQKDRVGRSAECDFYTSESLGACFAQLVLTAAEDLLGPEKSQQACFVEIAAEPGNALVQHWPHHPFAKTQVIRQGEALQIEGPVVIFANEWLDALPSIVCYLAMGSGEKKGVFSPQKGQLQEVLLDAFSPAVSAVAHRLPKTAPEGYQLDWPLAAENALTELMACEWSGLFLCFDYGKSWQTLLQDCPEGTARTYQNHVQGNDLLASPGAQDITCDIIWDPLKSVLHSVCAREPVLESQEAFLVQRAQRAAESIVKASAGSFSEAKQSLMQLMHPAHMGQRFQVLWGLRE